MLGQIIVLVGIVALFAIFGVVLGWANHVSGNMHGGLQTSNAVIPQSSAEDMLHSDRRLIVPAKPPTPPVNPPTQAAGSWRVAG